MFFTREDILKIQKALLQLGVKDSELPNAESVTYNDILSIVQDGKNKKIKIKDFFNQISLWKKESFINITDTYDKYYITLTEAINTVPILQRKDGLVITFQDSSCTWKIYQFRGNITEFLEKDKWFDLSDYRNYITESLLPDEEDITALTPDENGNSFLALKDRIHNPAIFNGKGYKFVRKNIINVELATIKISVTNPTTLEGDIYFNINNKGTKVHLSPTIHNTTKLVAEAIKDTLTTTYTDYEVTVTNSVVTLTRKYSGNTSPTTFEMYNTGVKVTVEDSTIIEEKNVITQEDISEEDTIYEIRYDFDLDGKTITIPNNCVLYFTSGKFYNGNINMDNTVISTLYEDMLSEVNINGSYYNIQEHIKNHQRQLDDKQSQIDDKQQQITSNDEDISLLQTRSTQMEETIKSIAATGGASQATAVTYNNEKSKLTAINIQSAVDEIVEKTTIKDEEGVVQDTPFRVVENDEFIMAVVDSEDRLLFGIFRATGKPYFPQNDMYHISQSEEFLWVILDTANHPLLGIQQDGTCWAAKAQWLDDIKAIKEALSSIDETLKTFQPKEDGKGLINLDVADSFFYISNDEYIIAVVDAENRILVGIKYDAQPYFPNHEMYSVITNEEWLYAIIDAEDKVLGGFRANDGHMFVGGIDISTFISDAIIDIADIKERIAHLSTIGNDEYLSIETDAEGKVIGYIAPDGSHYLYKVKSETIPTEFYHIEDLEGRTEITTDAEDKILGYRDSKGTRHEDKLHVNSLSLSSQGLSDFEQKLKESGFISGQGDWSEKSNLQIAEPRCAIINITSSDDKKAEWAVSKSDNKKYWMQFFDMNGNYFKKRIILNAQGNSSMAFEKKNGTIDICNDEWIGDDTFSLKIGNWVAQDSFHLKSYYFDFFKGAGVVSYKIIDEVDRTRPFYVNKPWKKAYIKDIYRDNDSIGSPNSTEHLDNLSLQIDNGARCVPDGFPCIVYLNGDFYGVYAFCLKKHRDNYHMDKSVASNIHLDGDLNESTLFGGSISWESFEIRNPKNLVYKTPIKSFIPNDKDSLSDAFLYDADKAQAEIAGDVNIQAYDSSKQYSLGDYVTYNKKVFMAIASSQGVEPKASKKAKDVFKDAASNGNWIDITFTNTVKSSIQRLSNSMSDITFASVQSEKFEEYFDKENLIDYELVQCALHDIDSQGFNWQIITYDGNKWYFCNYDKERVFGQTGSLNMLSSVPTEGMFIIGSGKGTPNEWVINNCKSELKERWEQLVRLGIFTEEHIISLYNDWISRIGEENYKLEYKKWINSPCNRDSMVNISDWKYDGISIAGWTNWDTFGRVHSSGDYVKEGNKIYQALSDNVNKVPSQNPDVWKDVTYNANKQYNPDDIVWQGVDDFFCFKCLKQTTGVAPISAFYDSYPRALGYHDNIWRLQSYISKYFEVMNKFINNIK